MRRSVLLLVVVLLGAGLSHAQPVPPSGNAAPPVREQIRTRVEGQHRGLDAFEAAGDAVRASDAVLQFYEQRQFAPAWVHRTGPTAVLDTLLAVLRRAERDGLRPADYHVAAIQSLREDIRSSRRPDPRRLTDLDLLATDAFLLYASHLRSGRVSSTNRTPTWTVHQPSAELLRALSEATQTGAVSEVLAGVRPPQPEYARLRGALRRYRRLAAAGGWPTVPDGETLREGDQGERVQRLRRRLRVGGDLSGERGEAPGAFGAPLHDAVVAFQTRHGLVPDGAVGAATRAALNVSAAERVQQIIVNLERWRWLPRDLGRRHVLVNIAGYWLRVVEDGAEVLRMPVITGTPYRQTPVFSGEISYLVFNPYWHVPRSIAVEDKLPEIQKDPGYLARHRFTVFQGWGADARPVDPATIPWDRLSADHFPYRLRQEPGPMNALGRVKFMFPNRHSVYLHDTPTRGLFARAERSFSSGCIRVARPMELAESLLDDRPEWSEDRIRRLVASSRTERTVLLREKVPVHLQYWTAWVEADGTVHFRKDVYQRDERVYDAVTVAPPAE